MPYRARYMKLADFALELILCLGNDMGKISLNNLFSGKKSPFPLSVRNLLLPFVITDPPLHIIENTKALIHVAGIGHVHCFLTEHKLRLAFLNRQYACYRRKQLLSIGKSGIVNTVLCQLLGKGSPLCLFHIHRIQIYPCGSVGGAKIND